MFIRCWKWRLLCSSKFERERTKPYCSTCVVVADFLRSHRGVACRMQCSRLRASLPTGHQLELGRSCLHKKGAAHHCPPSFWIGQKTVNPLSSYIKPQITPPSPLKVATCHGGSPWHIYLADLAPPRGKLATKTRRFTGRWGRGDTMHVAWLGSFSQRL